MLITRASFRRTGTSAATTAARTELRNFPLLLLAAGHGEQSMPPRGLIEHNGMPWLMRQLKRAAAVHCHRVVIVLGGSHRDYFRALAWLDRACHAPVTKEGMSVSATVVDHPELGVFAALQAGVKAIENEKYVGAYVLPIDVPIGSLNVWSHLRAHLAGDVAACVPELGGRPGYPVLLSHRYLTTLSEMPPESRLDVQLSVLPPTTIQRFDVEDPSIGMSINAADQWHKIVESETIV